MQNNLNSVNINNKLINTYYGLNSNTISNKLAYTVEQSNTISNTSVTLGNLTIGEYEAANNLSPVVARVVLGQLAQQIRSGDLPDAIEDMEQAAAEAQALADKFQDFEVLVKNVQQLQKIFVYVEEMCKNQKEILDHVEGMLCVMLKCLARTDFS